MKIYCRNCKKLRVNAGFGYCKKCLKELKSKKSTVGLKMGHNRNPNRLQRVDNKNDE